MLRKTSDLIISVIKRSTVLFLNDFIVYLIIIQADLNDFTKSTIIIKIANEPSIAGI
jgi:hypothetical protein